MKQYVLLVNNNDTFLGKYEEKEKCHKGNGIHHRAFVVLLKNKNDEVLLQFRKHIRWDKYWDVTAISHVLHLKDYDESYETAALRSLNAEVGISSVTLQKIGGFNYFAKYNNQCENEYCAVIIGQYDGEYTENKDVIYKSKWMKKDEFYIDIMQNPNSYTPWAIESVKLLKKYGF